MDNRYYCKNKGRRLLIIDNQSINGIDYLEVDPDQLTLQVYFLHPLPGQTDGIPAGPVLTTDNVRISGGVRTKNISVTAVSQTEDKKLTVTVNQAGDFSDYVLSIVEAPDAGNSPTGFDRQLSGITFSFKVNCPSDFDCKPADNCPPPVYSEPRINYLAKDFSSFRRVMLDRLSVLQQPPQESNPADLQIALVELLAYAGDHLSYYQDAVATEAYLFTARKRTSLRRHARLLDYHLHNGTNARAWVHITVEPGGVLDGGTLAPGTALLTGDLQASTLVPPALFQRLLQQEDSLVFETMHSQFLHSLHNEIQFYTWGDSDCCLPKGSTAATLRNPGGSLQLARYDTLVFEEILSPTTGDTAAADPLKRHVVRLVSVPVPDQDPLTGEELLHINWHEEDALPFAVCISAEVDGRPVDNVSVARGNMVLADHGLTIADQALVPESKPEQGQYRPRVPQGGLTVASPYNHQSAQVQSAQQTPRQSVQEAIPTIRLLEDGDTWNAERDLLNSDRFAKSFVAEIDQSGYASLRFGDNRLGQNPGAGFAPRATYRLGTGPRGNTGRDSLRRIVQQGAGILAVRNPLPASGGRAAESMEEVRQFAPEAFRTQARAVTEADYAEKTRLHPEVQNAVAQFRWTGSWRTVYITIDRRNGLLVNEDFKQRLYQHLDQYRMMGQDIEIRPPLFVPLEITMQVCVKPGYFREEVHKRLLQVFSSQILPDGTYGVFHPENFTFGQPLYVSRLYEKAMQIDGVRSVELQRFQRRGISTTNYASKGLIKAGFNEILQLDNDPNFPENGAITFSLSGGL